MRSVAHARGVTLAASRLGKIKMVSQVIAILLLILGRDHVAGLVVLGQVGLWVAMLTAVASAADYYRRYSRLTPAPEVTIEPSRQRGTEPAHATPVSPANTSGGSRLRA